MWSNFWILPSFVHAYGIRGWMWRKNRVIEQLLIEFGTIGEVLSRRFSQTTEHHNIWRGFDLSDEESSEQ